MELTWLALTCYEHEQTSCEVLHCVVHAEFILGQLNTGELVKRLCRTTVMP